MFLLEQENLRTPPEPHEKNHLIPVATSRAKLAHFLGETRWFDLLIARKMQHPWSCWVPILSFQTHLSAGSRTRRGREGLVSYLDSARSPYSLCRSSCRTLFVYGVCTTVLFSLVWDVHLSFLRRLNPGQRCPRNGRDGVLCPWPMHTSINLKPETRNTVPHMQPRSPATSHLVINFSHHPPLPNSIRSNENVDRSGLLIKTTLNSKFPRRKRGLLALPEAHQLILQYEHLRSPPPFSIYGYCHAILSWFSAWGSQSSNHAPS